MGPLFRTALPAFFTLLVFAAGGRTERAPETPSATASHAAAAASPSSSCPAHTLPDDDFCVHVPNATADEGGPESAVANNAHRVRSGRWQAYEDIPRRPERPSDYDAYRYPVPPGIHDARGDHSVVSGFDLDRPDDAQRRGRTLHAVGHGGVDLPQARGTPAHLVALDHQVGDAEVLFTGSLFGTTVLTRQTVREGGRLRDYVILYGHLDAIAPNVTVGATLKDGDPVGAVGDTGSPELVHLHWEARRVRDGVDVVRKIKEGGGGAALADEVSVVCDPRNVLPLREP